MSSVRQEPPVRVGAYALTAITRTTLTQHAQSGALFLTGHKTPVAVICRRGDHEEIFDASGRRIDTAALKALIADSDP